MLRNSFLGLMAVVLSLCSFQSAMAQTPVGTPPPATSTGIPQEPPKTESPKVILEASIADTQIFRQDENGFDVGMTLIGGEKIFPNGRIGIVLKQKNTVVDRMISAELIPTVEAKARVPFKLSYWYPAALSGDFSVTIELYSTSGKFITATPAGMVTILPKNVGVLIDATTCNLRVASGTEKYTLTQGVPLDATEALELVCTLTNLSNADAAVTPVLTTHRRSVYGSTLGTLTDTQQNFTLAAKESKTTTLTVPVPQDPQAYDVTVTLNNQDVDAPFSNTVSAHFVVRGQSATIQTATLDKTTYTKGEKSTIDFSWTGPVDNFPSTRTIGHGSTLTKPSLSAEILSQGQSCGTVQTMDLQPDSKTISFPITSDCQNPVVLLKVKEGNKTLDTYVFSADQKELIDSTLSSKQQTDETGNEDNRFLGALITTLALVVVVVGSVIVRRRRMNRGMRMIAFMLLGLGMVAGMGMQRVEAASTSWTSCYGGYWCAHYSASTNKDTYFPSEGIAMSTSSYWEGCGNSDPMHICYGFGNYNTCNGSSLTAPASPGTHTINTYGYAVSIDQNGNPFVFGEGWSSMSITVCDTAFTPDPSTVCTGTSFTQTNTCGQSRTAWGTKSCNNPPNNPTIKQVAGNNHLTGSPQKFSVVGTDPNNDNIIYGIDWDNNATVDQWVPTWGTYVASGTTKTTTRTWNTPGTYTVKALTRDDKGWQSAGWGSTTITILQSNRAPAVTFWGPKSTNINTNTGYGMRGTDPDGDNLRYYVSWGDGQAGWVTGWVGSGAYAYPAHSWSTAGVKTITAYAYDSHGVWSAPVQLKVTVIQPNGACGTANLHLFAYNETSYGAYTQCSSGFLNPPASVFPAQGASTTWNCYGISGGTSAIGCTASRGNQPTLKICLGGCIDGTPVSNTTRSLIGNQSETLTACWNDSTTCDKANMALPPEINWTKANDPGSRLTMNPLNALSTTVTSSGGLGVTGITVTAAKSAEKKTVTYNIICNQPCTFSPGEGPSNVCEGRTATGTRCNTTCNEPGTKKCDSTWREVAP